MTHHTCVHVQLLKDDIIEASAKIGDQTLPPPRYYRGDARKVLPLMQAAEADLQLRGERCASWLPLTLPQAELRLQTLS